MPPMTTIGERIKQALEESGKSYRDLAERMHTSATTVNSWINNPNKKFTDKLLNDIGRHTNGKPSVWFRYGDQDAHIDAQKFAAILAAVLRVNDDAKLYLDPDTLSGWAIEIYRLFGGNRRVDEDAIRRLMTVGRK